MATQRFAYSCLALCVTLAGLSCGADDAAGSGPRGVSQAGSMSTPGLTGGTTGAGTAGRIGSAAAGSGIAPGIAGTPAAIGGSPGSQVPPPPPTMPTRPPATGAGGMPGTGMPVAGTPATPPPPPGPPGTWPAADPAKNGPFQTVTENNVGPGMAYTMFRPMMLTQRHPVITWGNGTGTTPSVYKALLNMYASHGFIVIASNSMNVAQGTPPPMLDGVTWVLEQDMMQGSALYQHVDRDRIGATGHSQGAFAASSAGTDPRIKTIAPIETLSANRGLHGPALGLCGSMDTTVPCSGNMRSFTSISDQPVMYAELKTADHMNWIYSPGATNPYYIITTAWFRVHLMNDTALRPMFYGDCSLCKDTATWVTMRKMMDQ
jgi:hypothetical protein